jgi:glycosyltransferase involved in cell wall biosynthesis
VVGNLATLVGARVLAVHPSPDLYGSDRVLLDGLAAFRNAGARVEVVVPSPGRLTDVLTSGQCDWSAESFPVLRKALLRPTSLAVWAAGVVPVVGRLRRMLRQRRPDILYVNTVTVPHWIIAGRLEAIPVVCHVHELESELPNLLARGLLAPLLLATGVLVNSDATRRFLIGKVSSVARRCSVLYNGFHFPTLGPAPFVKETSAIAIVGRLSPRKGQDVALRALSILVSQGTNARLEIVGDAYEGYAWFEQHLRNLATKPELSGRVRFMGFRKDPADTYKAADLVLVPSRLEPFGNVAVEALGAGRPVVASNVGGLPEIVDHGVTGILVTPDDPVALAAAISGMLANPLAARQMGARGAQVVRRKFARERFDQEICEFMSATLAVGIA